MYSFGEIRNAFWELFRLELYSDNEIQQFWEEFVEILERNDE